MSRPKITPDLTRAEKLVREIPYEATGQFRYETRGGQKMSMKIMEPVSEAQYESYPLIISTNAHTAEGEHRPETLEVLVVEDTTTIVQGLAYYVRNKLFEVAHAKKELPKLLEALVESLGRDEDEKPPAPADPKWKLVNEEGLVKVVGDMVEDPGGDRYEITHLEPPHKPESTGKVGCTDEAGFTNLYFPSVVGLKFEEVSTR